MNTVHKIIEIINTGKFRCGDIPHEDRLQIEKEIVDVLSKTTVFVIEDLKSIPHGTVGTPLNYKNIHFPYANTTFEIAPTHRTDGETQYIVCNTDQANNKIILLIARKNTDAGLCAGVVLIENELGSMGYETYGDNNIDAVKFALGTIRCINEAMECSNIYVRTNFPDEAIQSKRKRNGKLPFFAYKTLHIRLPNKNLININDRVSDRASPRVHLRRGHIRHLHNGDKIWIQPQVIGEKKNGMIVKDYVA